MNKIVAFLLAIPFAGVAQTSHNPYSSVINEGNLYPTSPYQTENYPTRQNMADFTAQYKWDGNYETGHFFGADKAVLSAFSYVGIPTAWAYGINGTGVKVCVIDGNVVSQVHKDITINGSYNSVSGDENHGTSITGIIGARNNGGTGMLGVAYNAGIYEGNYYDIAGSIDWGLSQGCKVFNCSFDASIDTSILGAFKRVKNAGGVVVVAAGNNTSTLAQMLPLCGIDNVVTVAGQKAGGIDSFYDSVYTKNILPIGSKNLDFAVPYKIISPSYKTTVTGNNYYNVIGGSSSAAAMVSGMYALMMQRFQSVSVPILTEMLKFNSRKFINYGVKICVPNISFIR